MGDRNYSMHFIKFDGLKPATHYTYKVKSGAQGAQWSDEYTFRSMRPYPETRIAMYGDMGVSEYNNMANLLKDCQSGKIDLFAHMGDHCYGGRPHACFPAQPRPRFGVARPWVSDAPVGCWFRPGYGGRPQGRCVHERLPARPRHLPLGTPAPPSTSTLRRSETFVAAVLRAVSLLVRG